MFFKKVDQFDNDFPENDVDKIYDKSFKKIEEKLDEFIENTKSDPEMLTRRWADIREMIVHLNGRIEYWESRRTQFLQIGLAMFAASIAAIVTIIPNFPFTEYKTSLKFYIYSPVLISSIIIFFGSIRLINIWNRQNNPSYPFTKGYRFWRWQYRHAEKDGVDTDLYKYSKEKYESEIKKFADNMYNYKVKTLECDYKVLFDQDLSQLYLLIINEKFKIKFVNKLRDSLLNTLKIAFICGIVIDLIFIIFIFCNDIVNIIKSIMEKPEIIK
jgi:hypothetical protein